MKKILTFISLGLLMAVLTACGTDDEETTTTEPATDTEPEVTEESPGDIDEPADDTTTEESQSTGETESNETPSFNFSDFNLSVEIRDNEADDDDILEVEYEIDGSTIDAEYEDKQQEIHMQGAEAQEELENIFAQFTFDENTPDEEVIDEVLQAFNVQDGADEVEIDIEFTSGTEKEYKR